MHLPILYNINAWRLLILPVQTYLTYTLSRIFPFPRCIWVYTVSTHSVFQNVLNKRSFSVCTREFIPHKESKHHLFISGVAWKSQAWLANKYSSSENFERKNILLFFTVSPLLGFSAFHSQLLSIGDLSHGHGEENKWWIWKRNRDSV